MTQEPARRYSSDGTAELVPSRRSRPQLVKEAALAVPHLVILLGRLLRDRDVPRKRKIFAGVAMAYVISPFDLLPDAIPFVGRIDDIVLLAASIHYLLNSVPAPRLNEYWEGSEDSLDIVAGLIEWGADLIPSPIRHLFSM